jgi:hypothetical protein
MSHLVLLTETDPDSWGRMTDDERAAVMACHDAFSEAVKQRGKILGGEALDRNETARTLRTLDGERVVVAGPYAETVEQLGGYYHVDAGDLDEVMELCRLLPDHYVIEVRPVVDIEDL